MGSMISGGSARMLPSMADGNRAYTVFLVAAKERVASLSGAACTEELQERKSSKFGKVSQGDLPDRADVITRSSLACIAALNTGSRLCEENAADGTIRRTCCTDQTDLADVRWLVGSIFFNLSLYWRLPFDVR